MFLNESAPKMFALTLMSAMILLAASFTTFAAKGKKNRSQPEQPELWRQVDDAGLQSRRESQIGKYLVYRVDRGTLRSILNEAPLEFTDAAQNTEIILEIPTPEGKMERFRIEESPMLAPEIAAKFPTWKTYSGQGIDDPTAVARFDFNANGFHGYVLGGGGTFLIDPISLTDDENYNIYYKGGMSENREPFSCNVGGGKTIDPELSDLIDPNAFSNGTQLRTFKLAVSASRQYTNFFGGNVNTAFAAVQTTVNRMITVYRRELATTFMLVSGTNTVFTDANTGGFTNNSNTDLDRNQIVLDMVIGNANYDIGHILSVTPNPDGLATSPSLCDPMTKAQGFTGAPTPQGDGFDVDYVAHEIGHQFSMSHTFNNDMDGSCTTRSVNSAYEPASGVTIMGYAGICGPRNISANSIDFFNLRSFDQSLAYMQTTIPANYPTCGTLTATNNTPPANVNAGGSFNIPKQTPFTLTGSATDANGDSLTYLWEEFDLGAATRSTGANDTDEDGTARPIFRGYNASTSPSRTFPSLYYILNNANIPPLTYTGTLPFAPTSGSTNGYVCAAMENCVAGERLPSIARTMNFRVTVRDNNSNGGGVADAQATLTVSGVAGPFRVTTQDAAATWQGGSTQTVTWDVAGTTANGINAANVKISLSTDGGQTFPITIAASTPNDGTESITVPNNQTTTARIKVEAVGNIFFDINNVNFTITANPNARTARADYDGDGRTDLSVFRANEGNWYLNRSTQGFSVINFGAAADASAPNTIVPGDYDNDRKTDTAVFRPSNTPGVPDFYILNSNGFVLSGVEWGVTGDIPVTADYDNDGKTDVAVYRPGTQTWYVLRSSGGTTITQYGLAGDIPVVGDFVGDAASDITVFRSGTWYTQLAAGASAIRTFGSAGDKLVPADYDGDGKDDLAVFRAGSWYIYNSGSGTVTSTVWGGATDVPVPGDYDGDGKYDIAIYQNGQWWVRNSQSGSNTVTAFGTGTDVPTPRNYLPQ